MNANAKRVNWLLGLAGGIAGDALGYYLYFVLAGFGLYAIVLPGAAIGLICGALWHGNPTPWPLALLGEALGLFTESACAVCRR